MTLKFHLSVLGLNDSATPMEIKKRYRYLVSRWHPDRFANNPSMLPLAEASIKQINVAYEALCHLDRRETAFSPSTSPVPYPPEAAPGQTWPQRLAAMLMAALQEARRPAGIERRSPHRSHCKLRRRPPTFQDILAEMGASGSRLRMARRTGTVVGRRMDRKARHMRRGSGSGMRISVIRADPGGPLRIDRIRSVRPIGSDDS